MKNISTFGLKKKSILSRARHIYNCFVTIIVIPHWGIIVSCWMSVCLSVRLSVVRPSVRILFPDDNLSKSQWIFTKLGMCIDIVEIWFGIVNGRISSNFDGVICQNTPIFSFPGDNLSKHQWIFTT